MPATIQSLLHYLCATFNSSRPPETDHVRERLRIYYVQEGLPMRNPQRANVPLVHASLCYSTSTLGCSRVFEILDMKHGLRPFSIPPISQSNSALRAEQEQVVCARSWPNSTMPRLKLLLLTLCRSDQDKSAAAMGIQVSTPSSLPSTGPGNPLPPQLDEHPMPTRLEGYDFDGSRYCSRFFFPSHLRGGHRSCLHCPPPHWRAAFDAAFLTPMCP